MALLFAEVRPPAAGQQQPRQHPRGQGAPRSRRSAGGGLDPRSAPILRVLRGVLVRLLSLHVHLQDTTRLSVRLRGNALETTKPQLAPCRGELSSRAAPGSTARGRLPRAHRTVPTPPWRPSGKQGQQGGRRRPPLQPQTPVLPPGGRGGADGLGTPQMQTEPNQLPPELTGPRSSNCAGQARDTPLHPLGSHPPWQARVSGYQAE